MSVPNQMPESNYVGNGTTTTFAANFEYASDSDVFVTVNGVVPEIGQATFSNGVFTFTIAPANGAAVRVYRNTPVERDTEYDSHDNVFRPRVVNIDFDRIWYVLQEYLLSLGIANARITQEIADRIQADAEMMNYILNEDNELKADYILRDENLKKYVDQTIGAIIGNPDFQGIEAQFVKDSSGKNQQEINNALAGVGEKIKREFVSVWDFFTPSELSSYKTSTSGFDAYRPIQEFLDHISANSYGKAFFDGIFYTSKGFNFSVGNASLTKNIIGSPVIQAIAAIDTIFNIELGQDIVWDGIPSFLGTGNNTFSTRTCNHGLKIGNTASRARFKGVIARNFKQTGIYAYAGSTLANFGDVRLSNIASGHTGYSTWNLASTFSLVSNNGAASNTSQTSTISVGTLPPDDLITECMVNIGGQPYYVSSIDRANNTLNIFPWLDSANTETSLTYIFGAGVYLTSGDASVQRFTQIDAVRCGVAVWHGSIYPPVIDNLVTQYCGVGQILGIYPERAMVGGQVNGFYCENNAIDILRLTRTPSIGFYIMSNYAFNPNKVKFACAPRDSSNRLLYTYANLRGITIAGNDGFASYKKFPLNQSASTLAIDVTAASQSKFLAYNANSKTVNINTPDLQLNQLYGEDCTTLLFMGSTSATPTGTFTFNAPTGYTVNGQASVSFSGFSTAALFNIYLNVSASNFIVSCHGQASGNSASVTYDPPSLAAAGTAGDSVTTNVTLTGAALGNNVDAAFNKYNAAIEISAQVSAANTVTVKFKNTSAAAVDLPSGTLTVKTI